MASDAEQGRKPRGERAGASHAKRARLPARFPVLVTMKLCAGLQTLRANDVHALVEASDERSLSRAMNGLATRIARALNRLWERAGRVFAERYHALYLRTPRAVRNALIYVLQNGRKHGAWRAFAPDIYSSAPSFGGWRGRIEKAAVSKPGLLERARTWLLSVGWRKHGLIDPLEVPVGAEVRMCAAAAASRP